MSFNLRSVAASVLILTAVAVAEPISAKPLPGELAAKDRAIKLMPDSQWHLEYGEDRCRLARSFTSDDGPGMLLIEQLAPGERFDITFAAHDFAKSRRGSWFYAGARKDRPVVVIDPIEYEKPGYGDAITLVNVSLGSVGEGGDKDDLVEPSIDLAGAERVDRFVLQRSARIVSFETGNMRGPIEAMNVCTNELAAVLGLGEEAGDKHTPPIMPNERSYFQALHHDLASTPGNEGHEAVLRVRAMIAPDGSVEDCYHEYPLNTGGLLPDVCANVSGMRFTPAKSADGQAFRSVYMKSIYLSPHDPWRAGSHGGRDGS